MVSPDWLELELEARWTIVKKKISLQWQSSVKEKLRFLVQGELITRTTVDLTKLLFTVYLLLEIWKTLVLLVPSV